MREQENMPSSKTSSSTPQQVILASTPVIVLILARTHGAYKRTTIAHASQRLATIYASRIAIGKELADVTPSGQGDPSFDYRRALFEWPLLDDDQIRFLKGTSETFKRTQSRLIAFAVDNCIGRQDDRVCAYSRNLIEAGFTWRGFQIADWETLAEIARAPSNRHIGKDNILAGHLISELCDRLRAADESGNFHAKVFADARTQCVLEGASTLVWLHATFIPRVGMLLPDAAKTVTGEAFSR